MSFYDSYVKTAGRLLSTTVDPYLYHFTDIKKDLKRANMSIMLREHISVCFLTLIITLPASLAVSFVILYFVLQNLVFASFLSIITMVGSGVGSFLIMLKYPAIKASSRSANIDNNLPFAVLYMNTIAGTGAPPYLMFKLLSEFKEYGEVAKEAQEIVEDIEVKGQDISVALRRVAESTPSEKMKELLWSISTATVGGGDIVSLLEEKAEVYMNDYRRMLNAYTENVSLYLEVYITLVIVGSIFSTVMLTIMGAISGFQSLLVMQQALVYIFLPMAGIVFLVMLKLTSPVS